MSDNENVNKVMYFLDRVKVNPVKEDQPQETPATAKSEYPQLQFYIECFLFVLIHVYNYRCLYMRRLYNFIL